MSSKTPNSQGSNGTTYGGSNGTEKEVALCASCDRCRSRKTKCDGQRPCGNCAAKYLKKHKLSSIEGIDISLFECVYSPAKRRGPVPGRAGQTRKAEEMESTGGSGGSGGGKGGSGDVTGNVNLMSMAGLTKAFGGIEGTGMDNGAAAASGITTEMLQQHLESQKSQLAALGIGGNLTQAGNQGQGGKGAGGGDLNDPMALQRQLLLQQQTMALQNLGMDTTSMSVMNSVNGGAFGGQGQAGAPAGGMGMGMGMGGGVGGAGRQAPVGGTLSAQQAAAQQQLTYLQQLQSQQQQHILQLNSANSGGQPSNNQRIKLDPQAKVAQQQILGLAKCVSKNLSLIEKSSADGNRLRSYYTLSIDELFCLPPIPSDEEYCAKLNLAGSTINFTPSMLPPFDIAALRAARFSEIALGALANNQVALALELSNATVTCLRECVEEPIHPNCMFDVARAYLLHGIFRSYRGDMDRYFKYRRVCLTHISQLDKVPGVESLIAAISFHDSWAYMMHNANEDDLPNIDDVIAPVSASPIPITSAVELKYDTNTKPSQVVSDPKNQMWIQGPPPVFINNEAPPLCRSLDALACAIRSCCDQANKRFEDMARQMGSESGAGGNDSNSPGDESTTHGMSPTSLAVTANQDELCSRNMVLSAFTLLQQHEAVSRSTDRNHGHHLIVSAMDAFLEGGDEEEAGGFTDSQIQSLLSVCNTAVEQPLILYQGGPTYHMVTNAAILLCHLLNGLHVNRGMSGESPGEMEAALFDEVLDTYISVRKLLNIHRRKLPVMLRCHGLPRPSTMSGCIPVKDEKNNGVAGPFVDLGETLMCGSRGCQGFVLMACSPCVAAERAQAAKQNLEIEARAELEMAGHSEAAAGVGGCFNDFDQELLDLGADYDMDDDKLLTVLSRIIAA